MVRKQILRDREHSRESLLEKVKAESDQNKLKFNIRYYPVFQNVRNILQELPKPVVNHLKFKVGYLPITLRRS